MDNPAFDHVDTVKRLSNRLYKRLGIIAFTFSRVYKDGSRCELWNDLDALKYTFVKTQNVEKVYTPPFFMNQTFAVYDIVLENFPARARNKMAKHLQGLESTFDYANCIVLIDYQDQYTEYCMFYTHKKETQAINRYLNDLDYLKSFRRFFRHMAKDCIYEVSSDKIMKPWILGNDAQKAHDGQIIDLGAAKEIYTGASVTRGAVTNVKDIITGVKTGRTINGTGVISGADSLVRLTAREEEVSSYVMDGSTAKEIAEALCISPKTVEKHILNINGKFGTNRRAKLISELNRYYDR